MNVKPDHAADKPMPLAPEVRPDSLAASLQGAALAVAAVHGGSALPAALTASFKAMRATPEARGAIQDIAYRSMRQRGTCETLIGLLSNRPPQPEMLHGLLCCALALLLDPEQPYEPFTVVDQAVTAAAGDLRIAHAKGMVNAVLRRFLRERDSLIEQALKNPEALWNYPDWWINVTKAAYPQQWQAILSAGNAVPPLTLRINQRKTDMQAYLALLQSNGMEAVQLGPTAVRLLQPVPVSRIPGFDQGLVSVQDAAAQLAAPLLDLHAGQRVLDACAAPGGKSGHLLETADIKLTAIDVDAARLKLVQENLDRLQLQAQLVAADASGDDWWDKQTFDRILADVPCTASGIVRRHPDIRWLRRKGDAAQLARQSGAMLDNLWRMLAPGGKLLLVTCSLWPNESTGQADAFAMRNNAIRLPAPGQLLPTVGTADDHDGLFYALFQKPAV